MNSRQFIIASIVFLLEARNYDIAASYLLHDACNYMGLDNRSDGWKAIKENLTKLLRENHVSIRGQYPNRITLEQMREIAKETYEQVYKFIFTGEFSDCIIYS
jgi:hypothetical protein